MPKPIIITSLKVKGRGQVKALRDLCKYLQYRDGSVRREAFLGPEHRYPEGVSDYIRPEHRDAKWVDRGMGETYKQIANRAYDWQGRRMLARTWVISPDPELMKHVPDAKRFEIVRNVTERTLERWYSDNGWGQAEYSYVIHDKHRAADGEQMVHAHVVTPATIPVDDIGELGRIDHYVGKLHVWDLHRTTAESFEEELGRVLGKKRTQEVIAERNARLERERNHGKNRHERVNKLRTLADVMQLLEAERIARQAKKEQGKQKRGSQQIQTELRMYARYVSEERHKHREADSRRMASVHESEREAELERERARHRAHVAEITERGKRIPTRAEILDEEKKSRRLMLAYYASLSVDTQQDKDRAYGYQDIER